MQRLWKSLKYEKYDVTKYGHWSGTGLIVMNSDIIIQFEKKVVEIPNPFTYHHQLESL
jgi:hypothetical protein